jgi:hypothetical protein
MDRIKLLLAVFLAAPLICQAQNINNANCLNYAGGGGFGDFDCYSFHAKALHSDSVAIVGKIKQGMPKGNVNLARLDAYMLAQDQAVQYCQIEVDAAQDWQPGTGKKTHIDMYDVIDAKCQYDIRKHQNAFLRDVLGSATDE